MSCWYPDIDTDAMGYDDDTDGLVMKKDVWGFSQDERDEFHEWLDMIDKQRFKRQFDSIFGGNSGKKGHDRSAVSERQKRNSKTP